MFLLKSLSLFISTLLDFVSYVNLYLVPFLVLTDQRLTDEAAWSEKLATVERKLNETKREHAKAGENLTLPVLVCKTFRMLFSAT